MVDGGKYSRIQQQALPIYKETYHKKENSEGRHIYLELEYFHVFCEGTRKKRQEEFDTNIAKPMPLNAITVNHAN